MNKLLILWAILNAALIIDVKCDMFTSIEQMTNLVRTQEELTSVLKVIVDHQYQKLEEAKKYKTIFFNFYFTP